MILQTDRDLVFLDNALHISKFVSTKNNIKSGYIGVVFSDENILPIYGTVNDTRSMDELKYAYTELLNRINHSTPGTIIEFKEKEIHSCFKDDFNI